MKKRTTQEYLLMSISAFTALGVLPFVFYRIIHGEYLTAVVDTVIAVGLIAIFCLVFFERKVKLANHFLAVTTLVGISAIVYLKGASHLYWGYPAVVAAFYLFSIFRALLISCLFSFLILALSYEQLAVDLFFTILVTLIITCIFAFVFSKKMHQQNRRLAESSRITKLRNNTLELMVSSKSIHEILRLIALNIEAEYPQMRCSILLLDNNGHQLNLGAAPSLPEFYNQAIDGILIGDGIGSCGTAAFKGERVIVEDINHHAYWQEYLAITQKAKLGACWSEPIKNADGKVLGTFAIYHDKPTTPSEKDLLVIEQFAHLASIAIEREMTSKIIWQQANFDSLTGLSNRNMMVEHLKQAMHTANREQSKIAVAFIDLDHFKDINDTLGHAVGDLLLIEVANRISSNVRKNDTVARLGGDEFVIIYADFHCEKSSAKLSEKILNALAQPYKFKEQVVHTSASIGMTVYPDDASDVDNLLKNADQAMYCAKNAGRNSCYFFTESMRELASNRLIIINDLRAAIAKQEFFVVYQPIINLSSHKIEKVEALIRWQHPSKGLISPLEFISIAEETGLIIDVSNYLFEQVLIQAKLWREFNSDFQISVNTSPVQYKKHDGNILQWLAKLQQQQIDKTAIVLEITENLLMESQSDIEEVLNKVREVGVEIAIDDFGTGYSSFAYLREYKTDYVKIDKSFVDQMAQQNNDSALCEAIIVMAKKLNIQVIAEGIETQEQQTLLTQFGCDLGQGYLFSKPVLADEITQLLTKEN